MCRPAGISGGWVRHAGACCAALHGAVICDTCAGCTDPDEAYECAELRLQQ